MDNYPMLKDAGLAIVLSLSLFLMTEAELFDLHPVTYVILTPIVFFVLLKKRKAEEEEQQQ